MPHVTGQARGEIVKEVLTRLLRLMHQRGSLIDGQRQRHEQHRAVVCQRRLSVPMHERVRRKHNLFFMLKLAQLRNICSDGRLAHLNGLQSHYPLPPRPSPSPSFLTLLLQPLSRNSAHTSSLAFYAGQRSLNGHATVARRAQKRQLHPGRPGLGV
jgi:hypothetical protein